MKWIRIPDEYFIEKDKVQYVRLSEKSFCLVFHQKKWFAFSSRCPHAGAPLSNGWCVDGHVVCPYHRYRFDLNTGRGDEGHYITIYPLREEEGKWYIGHKPSLWQRVFG